MRLASLRIALVVAALAPLAALAQVTPPAPPVAVAPPPWSFSLPAPAQRAVTAPVTLPDALPFQLAVSGVAPSKVTQVGFMVMGNLQAGDVTNYELVYYPNGFSNPGVVVGSSSGAGWAHGATSSIVTISLPTPVVVSGDASASFALRASVNSTRSFYFQPRLQTVTIDSGGGQEPLLNTELPVNGDVVYVN